MPFPDELKQLIPEFNSHKIKFYDIEELSKPDQIFVDSFLSSTISPIHTYASKKFQFSQKTYLQEKNELMCLVAKDSHYNLYLGAILFSLEYEGEIVKSYIIGLATNPMTYHIRNGVGSLLLLTAINIVRAGKASLLEIYSSINSIGFYESFGMLKLDQDRREFTLNLVDIELGNSIKDNIFSKYRDQRMGHIFYLNVHLISEEAGLYKSQIIDEVDGNKKTLYIVNLPLELSKAREIITLPIYIHYYSFSLSTLKDTAFFFGIYFTPQDIAAYKIQSVYLAYKQKPAFLKYWEYSKKATE